MGSYLTGFIVAAAVIAGMLGLLTFSQDGQTKSMIESVAQSSHDDLIIQAANDNGDEQLEAILQLGIQPGDVNKTVRMLSEFILKHPSELVRNAAAISLHNLGEQAVPAVRELVEQDDVVAISMGCSAIKEIGPAGKVFLPRIKEFLNDDDYLIQRRGLFALQGIGPDSIALIDEVIQCLDIDEEILRANPNAFNNQLMACRVLETLGPDALPAEPVLLRVLEEGNPSSKSYAALVLGSIGPTDKTDTAKLLGEQLKSHLQIQKQRTLLGLAYMGPEAGAVEDQVRTMMNETSEHVMPYAAYALWKITGKADESLEVLEQMLKNPNYRDDAIELLGKMQEAATPLVGRISQQLAATEDGTVELAVVALGNIGPGAASALNELRSLANHKDALIRYQAREAIKQIENPTPNGD